MTPIVIWSLLILLAQPDKIFCWDNEDLEVFDLVEEINTNFYTLLGVNHVSTLSILSNLVS